MSSSPSFVIQLLLSLERMGNNDASLFSWDTWDVDERFVRQIIEAANRRAGKIITDEDKARRQRQMKNAEKVKELAMAISKKNNSVAEREMDPVRRAALQVKVQRLKEEFDKKLAKHRQVLHSDLVRIAQVTLADFS
ncbi:unnamed protein product [Haemonchus placei]|uniref:V-type proton ATPase subunit G n=1 Tax=Haemonchus placei TaxID=6290 RepID=A0A0N4WRJ0_HAEPC|nr:unnamed protein product [Haemonchus placei]